MLSRIRTSAIIRIVRIGEIRAVATSDPWIPGRTTPRDVIRSEQPSLRARSRWAGHSHQRPDRRFRRSSDRAAAFPAGPAGLSAVLTVLRFEEPLAQSSGRVTTLTVMWWSWMHGMPRSGAGQERRCGQWVAQAQDELWPGVEGGGYPGQLESIGQDLVFLRALGGPWWAQHSARTVRLASAPSTWTRSPDGTVMVAGFSSRPSCAPRRSSITRSAPRCSVESPAGAAPAPRRALSACCAFPGNGRLDGAGVLPDSLALLPEPFVDDLAVRSGRRRTSPSRSSARQIWFADCRGEMPVRAATWSSSRGRWLSRIVAVTRSR